MAETVADSRPLGHDDDIDFLEIDYDENDDIAEPEDHSGDLVPTAEASADDFDFQINEIGDVDDTGEENFNGNALSGDSAKVELAVPQVNRAESEIGYDDEEPLEPQMTGEQPETISQQQGSVENTDLTDHAGDNEIDYSDAGLDDDEENNDGIETQAAVVESGQENVPATGSPFQQGLDATVAPAKSAEAGIEAGHEPIDETAENLVQVGHQDDSVPRTGDDAAETTGEASLDQISDVKVLYNGTEYELCAGLHNDDPETYFFAGSDNLDAPLWEFIGRLRDVIKDEIEPSDDLVINIPELKLEFGEGTSSEFLYKRTFRDILDLCGRLRSNDDLEHADHPQLVVHLLAKPNCQERFAMLTKAADEGLGWSEVCDSPYGSDSASSQHSFQGEFDEDQAEAEVEMEQPGDDEDDVIEPEGVVIVEEAYFYDDANEGDGPDSGHLFDHPDTEDHDHHGFDMGEPVHDTELASELAEYNELNQMSEHFDEHMGDDEQDATHQTYIDNDDSVPVSEGKAGSGDVASPAPTVPGGTGSAGGGDELGNFDDEADPALEASNMLSSGKYTHFLQPSPASLSDTEHELLDDSMDGKSEDAMPGTWDLLAARPTTTQAGKFDVGDEDLIDYSDDEDFSEQPASQYKSCSSPTQHVPSPSGESYPGLSPMNSREAGFEDASDEIYEAQDEHFIDYEADDTCSSPAGTEENPIPIETDCSDVSDHGGSPVHMSSPACVTTKHNNANISDLQVQQEPAIESKVDGDVDFDVLPQNDTEQHDGDVAANDDSIDIEGLAAYDEAANNEPLVADANIQVTESHNTSATSTLNGDEITYEEENVALFDIETGGQEAGDDVEDDENEIDWENDGAEDVAVAEEPTNQSSPSGLSVKRGREEDDLIGLDDETAAKRQKI